ncbi:MAG: GNAT family N-acetyltransferase, partial [Gammaproteobacteria bacterium]
DPERRRRGHGGYLLRRLIQIAGRLGARTLFLEVRPSNAAALALYRRLGFEEVGRRRGYYPAMEGREDALVLALALG